MKEMTGWSRKFEEPILRRDGRHLEDAGTYITTPREAEHTAPGVAERPRSAS